MKCPNCQKRVTVGGPYCWLHTLEVLHLRVLPSSIRGAGRGVFARQHASRVDPRAVLFRKGDWVAPYGGAERTQAQLDKLYKAHGTSEYAVCHRVRQAGTNRSLCQDAQRGAAISIGGLVNHASGRLANVKLAARGDKIHLRATRDIRDGREVLMDYGRHPSEP